MALLPLKTGRPAQSERDQQGVTFSDLSSRSRRDIRLFYHDALARARATMIPAHHRSTTTRNPRLRLLITAIQQQEADVAQHSQRTQRIALALGKRLSLDQDTLKLLDTAAALHDIGKFLIPAEILNKPGPLTRREREIIEEHAHIGEWLCHALPSLHPVLPGVRGHHERLDGSGYPDGLAGSQLPLPTQILQLADASDALLSSRPYRAALPLDQAAHLLEAEAQRGWRDHALTDTCLTVLDHLYASKPAVPSPPSHNGGVLCLTSPAPSHELEALFARQSSCCSRC